MTSPTRSPPSRRRASSPSTTPLPPGTRRTRRGVRRGSPASSASVEEEESGEAEGSDGSEGSDGAASGERGRTGQRLRGYPRRPRFRRLPCLPSRLGRLSLRPPLFRRLLLLFPPLPPATPDGGPGAVPRLPVGSGFEPQAPAPVPPSAGPAGLPNLPNLQAPPVTPPVDEPSGEVEEDEEDSGDIESGATMRISAVAVKREVSERAAASDEVAADADADRPTRRRRSGFRRELRRSLRCGR